MQAPSAIELERPRTLGELLSETFAIFGRQANVFLTATLIAVTPVTLLVEGVWGRALADGPSAEASPAVQGVSAALNGLVVLPLVTVVHVVVLEAMARREELGVRDALRAAASYLPPAVATVLLYSLAVFAGTLALILPGIWIAIRWYFGVQAVVVEGLRPAAALRRSAELVRGSWWRTLGMVLVIAMVALVLAAVMSAVAAAFGSPPVYVTGVILAQAVTLSLSATFGSLLFFDLRARRVTQAQERAPGEWRPEAPE